MNMLFGTWMRVPVRAPFRLDLTVDALRRLASNAVDVVDEDGTYYRAVRDARGAALLNVRATARAIEFRATGENAQRWLPLVERTLGARTDLRHWYARSDRIDWLARLAARLRGLKPPRYPTLWEACAHAVVFAQISIYAGAAIMRRLVELLGEEVCVDRVQTRIFPEPARWLRAGEATLRDAGLSRNKLRYLRSIATALSDGTLDEDLLAAQSTTEAAQTLIGVPGIGPWSAAVVLLRGLGRLDVFPLRDSGVARSVAALAGPDTNLEEVLAILGSSRGMLYFHLLLGRLGRH